MKTRTVVILVLAGLAFVSLSATAWANGPEVLIWKKIQANLKVNRYRSACELALKLQPYKETPTYSIAEEALKKKGISIGDPLGSFTIMQIIALQNHTEAIRAKTGRLPEPGPRKKYEDGWYRALRIEQLSRKTFAYLIRSAGADGIWMSKDDYVIGQRRLSTTTDSLNAQKINTGAREVGRRSMYTGQTASKKSLLPGVNDPGIKTGKTGTNAKTKTRKTNSGEKQITIDDLLSQ